MNDDYDYNNDNYNSKDKYINQMPNIKGQIAPLKFNHQEGKQSLIKLSPNAFSSESGDNKNQAEKSKGTNKEKEEDEIDIEEIGGKDERDDPLFQEGDKFERQRKENIPTREMPINKNTTIKNIVGYKSKQLTNHQLNDAIDPESNINIEEEGNDNEEANNKITPFNTNEDNEIIPSVEEGKETEADKDKHKQPKEEDKEKEERNYEIEHNQYDDGFSIEDNHINNINEEEDKYKHHQGMIQNNINPDKLIHLTDHSSNQNMQKNSIENKKALKQPNSISIQENMTIGYYNKKLRNINSNNNNNNNGHDRDNNDDLFKKQLQESLLITSIPKKAKCPPSDIFHLNAKLPYHQQKNPQVPLSKLQIAENKYLSIKSSLLKLFNQVDTTEDESTIDYNHHIEKMLSYLDQLNTILNVIIESRKASKLSKASCPKLISSYSKTQLDQIEASNAKLLNNYEKQYLSMKARYDQISDKSYVFNIQHQTKQLDEKISLIEAENRQLRTNQVISENIFVKKVNEENNLNRLKKMTNETEKYQAEYEKILRRIDDNQIAIKDNNAKIEQLAERERELKKSAKEKYDLEEFDNIKQLEKKEKEKEEMIQKWKKKIQILNHAYKANQRKYNKEIEDNQRTIAQLELDRNELMELLQQKKALPSEATLILDTNNGAMNHHSNGNDINNNNLSSINNVSAVIPGGVNSSIDNNTQGNKRYHFNQTVPTNQNVVVNKEMVLKELEKKQKAEEIHNMFLDDPKVNTSIVLKKIALKPNFSFNKKQLNEVHKEKAKLNSLNTGKSKVINKANDENNIIEEINEEKRRLNNNNNNHMVDDKEKRKKDVKRKRMLNTPFIDDIIGGVDKEEDTRNEGRNLYEDEYDENEHEHIFEVEFDDNDDKRRDHVNIQFNSNDNNDDDDN